MISDFLIYLLEVFVATGLVAGLYNLLLAKLTFFGWNRWYILSGVAVALVVPLLPSAFNTGWPGFYQQQNFDTFWLTRQLTIAGPEPGVQFKNQIANEHYHLSALEVIMWIFLIVYAIGVLYKSYILLKNLCFVFNLRRSAKRVEVADGHIIYTQQALPSFSFGGSIFLHSATASLSREEIELIISHERAHIKLGHTWDIMFIEITRVFFWFNPFLAYLSASLKTIHEYQADAQVTGAETATVSYGKLIVKLASAGPSFSLIHTFSDSQIFNRIQMLTKLKSSPMQKLRFLWSLPAMALIVVVCSCLGKEKLDSDEFTAISETGKTFNATGLRIGKISWEGNTKYTDQELNDILGVKPGDPCDTTRIYNALDGGLKAGGKDIVSLYMDKGYLFFRVESRTTVNGNIADLSFAVYEGGIAKIRKVTFAGIKKLNALELIEKIETKPGELFSRTKLINSQRILSEMGKFDPRNVNIQPTPLFGADEGKVDIAFTVKEI